MITLIRRLKMAWWVLIGRAFTVDYWVAESDIYINGNKMFAPNEWTHIAIVRRS